MTKMRKSSDKKKKLPGGGKKVNVKKLVVFIAAVLAVIYFAYFVIWQQVTISGKNKEIDSLKQQVEERQKESEQLKQQIENLNDPEYIEKVAREKLGLVRPNERIFIDSNKSEDNAD